MALKIIPPHDFAGTRAGIDFAHGTTEVESIGPEEFLELAASGFVIEGTNVPTAEQLAEAARAEADIEASS